MYPLTVRMRTNVVVVAFPDILRMIAMLCETPSLLLLVLPIFTLIPPPPILWWLDLSLCLLLPCAPGRWKLNVSILEVSDFIDHTKYFWGSWRLCKPPCNLQTSWDRGILYLCYVFAIPHIL